MKKSLAVILVIAMILSLGLTACSSEEEEPSYDLNVYNYDWSEYLTLGQYKGVEVVPVEVVEVTDEDVQEEIQSRLEAAKTTEYVKEGVVANGDTLNIDYVGTMNGEEFTGGTSDPSQGGKIAVIGQGYYIPGFEEGLIGASVGDVVPLDLTFPEDYGTADLAGQDVHFDVTINSIMVEHVPEYNLDFVKANSECTSIEEYEKSVYDELYAAAQEQSLSNWESALWDIVYYNTEFKKCPEEEIEAAKNQYYTYYESYIAQMGYTVEKYLEMTGATQEDYDQAAEYYAQNIVENNMMLYAIADAEGLRITEDEFKKGVSNLVLQAGFSSDADFKAQYGKYYADYVGVENIVSSLTMEKVFNFIKENVVYQETEE